MGCLWSYHYPPSVIEAVTERFLPRYLESREDSYITYDDLMGSLTTFLRNDPVQSIIEKSICHKSMRPLGIGYSPSLFEWDQYADGLVRQLSESKVLKMEGPPSDRVFLGLAWK